MSLYVVAGGGGFIGSNVVESLLKEGSRVRVLDNFATGRRQNLAESAAWARAGGGEFELMEGDIRNAADCSKALKGADFVLHFAAIPSVQRSVEDPSSTNEVNITGTLRLLETARAHKIRRFVFSSSSSVYGESESLPKIETMPLAPISPYALQKLAGETYSRIYHRLYGLPTIALRYFNVFGPRQDPNSEYAAVVPRFMTAVREGRQPVIYGDGEQSRDFTFVENVVRANLLACQAGPEALGEAFNIACGERISLNQLLAEIARFAGTEVKARYEAPRKGDVRHSLAAIARAGERLHFRPEVSVRDGLKRLWDSLSR